MAGSKKKRVRQKCSPLNNKRPSLKSVDATKRPVFSKNPNKYYDYYPSWNFKSIDKEKWAFTKDNVGDYILSEILPKLANFESQSWKEILVGAKNNNHSICVKELNKDAQTRLDEKYIEAESIISLRITGNHRIYGYINDAIFNVLWYDKDHGDNDTCVCKSKLKHT